MATALDLSLRFGQRQAVTATPAMQRSDDAGLVAAARGGDRAAFGQLYERYVRMVHGILLTRVPPGEAADLVHDVFLAALRQLHTLRQDGAFGGWLAMITRNRATDYHRRSTEKVELPEDMGRNDPPGAEANAVLRVVQSLPDAYREPLILRLVEGMTGPEIAARTGLTPGSVRVNLHRGMKMLREKLEWSQGHE